MRTTLRLALLSLGAALLLAACTAMSLTTTYNPSEASWASKPGTATVSGQAFLRRNDGMVVYGAGSEATLTPKSTYADERFSKAFPNGAHLSYTGMNFTSTDPAYASSSRTTIADGEGRFTFSNLPAGSYYLTVPVTWMVQYQQGGLLMMPITLAAGESKQVILNGQ